MDDDWADLLAILTVPRENGSAGLRDAAEQLVGWLGSAGISSELIEFVAEPYALRLAGIVALLGCILYLRCMRERRSGAALLVALATPLLVFLDLDLGWPIFSWLQQESQVHVSALLPSSAETMQHLIVSAHYDTKTDVFDHAQRAWVEAAIAPLLLWMLVAAVLARRRARRPRLETVRRIGVAGAPWAALAFGGLVFLTLTGGAFVGERSPGALDDGASCAAALRLAERIAAQPLAHTSLEVLLLSAEEVGTQGARKLASRRFENPPALPTAVLNLESLGAAPDLAYLEAERFTLRRHAASARLVALADETHRERRGAPLHRLGVGVTDAREFLARGVSAVTLLSHREGPALLRGLHSAADDRSRIDTAALAEHLEFLDDLVRRIDRTGL